MNFLAVSGVFFIAGLALEGITSWIAIRVARKRHPELWVHSGKPTLLGNGDLMKAWPLVRYYRDRAYLKSIRQDGQQFSAVKDVGSLEFAERVRTPLLYGYYAGWAGVLIAVLMSIAAITFHR